MKKIRIINAVICSAIAITLCYMVTMQWHSTGCGFESCVAGCLVYSSAIACIGLVIDETIKEYQKSKF